MKFVENPWLPEDDCTTFIIDKKAQKYSNCFQNVILTISHSSLMSGIDAHPDMCVCHLGGGYIAVAKEQYDYYNKILSLNGFTVICGENDIAKDYPYDIAFNCVLLNNRLFHKLSYTDKAILKYAEQNNFELVDVKQGYTKCSTLIVDNNSVITSDEGLYKIYKSKNIDVLKVDNTKIALENFNYGFIGGTGGLVSKNKMAFFGKIKDHINYNNIKEFLSQRNIEIIELSSDKLTDYGSIIPLIHK